MAAAAAAATAATAATATPPPLDGDRLRNALRRLLLPSSPRDRLCRCHRLRDRRRFTFRCGCCRHSCLLLPSPPSPPPLLLPPPPPPPLPPPPLLSSRCACVRARACAVLCAECASHAKAAAAARLLPPRRARTLLRSDLDAPKRFSGGERPELGRVALG